MKRTIATLALAAAIPGLAGCGEQTGGNTADQVNLQASENVLLNALQNAGSPAPSAPLANNIVEPAEPAMLDAPQPRERPVADDGNSLADDARRPPPKAPRPQPEPDPHAGHDMGNMANMSHD